MLRATKLLCKLQLCNLFGFNEARFTKDKKKKSRILTTGAAMLLLGGMMAFYAAGLTAIMILMNAQNALAPILAAYTSMMVIAFTIFRAGPVLFNEKTYEQLVVLPVPPAAIITARFFTLYAINAALSLLMTVSSLITSAVFGEISVWYCVSMLAGSLIVPLAPMTVSMIFGTLLHAATSRMKRKQLMNAAIMIAIVLGTMFMPQFIEEENDSFAQLAVMLNELTQNLISVYPPLGWFAKGIEGNYLLFALFCIFSIAVFAAFALIVGKFFKRISTSLSSHNSTQSFVMKKQQETTVFNALFKRELKRYFASSVYVMNTLIGFILCIIFAVSMLFGDRMEMFEMMPIPASKSAYMAAFLPALMCMLSPTTTSAISMEGKTFWLVRSLPIKAKTLIDAKLCVQLVFALPTTIISFILLIIAVRPKDIATAIVMLLVPLVYAFFGSVAGLWCNIKNPLLNWESEAAAVKQSNAVLVMMLISLVSTIIPMIACFLLPQGYDTLAAFGVCAVVAALSAIMYKTCTKIDLNKIEE